MATNSTIAVQLQDGTVSQIFCHWDGQLSHNGQILFENYNDLESADSLVCLGNLSSLGVVRDEIDACGQSNCVYQCRDKNENWFLNKPNSFETIESYKQFMKTNSCEFNYLFITNNWFVSEGTSISVYLEDALLFDM